jgi:hypothetical protein
MRVELFWTLGNIAWPGRRAQSRDAPARFTGSAVFKLLMMS